MIYVIPRGTKVVARKGDAVRNYRLNEQLTFGEDDLAANKNARELSFMNGEWTLTAKKNEVDAF